VLCGGLTGIARPVVAPQAKPWGEQKGVIKHWGRGLAFEQTVKYCGYCLHPSAATPIEGKCFTQKMQLKMPFSQHLQLLQPIRPGGFHAAMTQNAPTCASPGCLQRQSGAGRRDLGLRLFPSTTRVFQAFLKFLVIHLGVLCHA